MRCASPLFLSFHGVGSDAVHWMRRVLPTRASVHEEDSKADPARPKKKGRQGKSRQTVGGPSEEGGGSEPRPQFGGTGTPDSDHCQVRADATVRACAAAAQGRVLQSQEPPRRGVVRRRHRRGPHTVLISVCRRRLERQTSAIYSDHRIRSLNRSTAAPSGHQICRII